VGEERARGFLTRAELLARLEREGIVLTPAQLRRHQSAGVIPNPRRYGRKGRGRGVDWGWPLGQVPQITRRLKLVTSGDPNAAELERVLRRYPKLLDYLDTLVEQARHNGFEDGHDAAFREMDEETA